MKILNGVTQGSEAWHQARGKYHTASMAPAMMGVGKLTRNELLAAKAEGAEKEHSRFVEEVIFARGHEVEAASRPIAEAIIGDELFPATGVCDDDYLLASFDGITMDESVIWECKQFNQAKAESVRNGKCPDEDYWQVVHQLAVSGAEKCVYMVSDGTETECLEVMRDESEIAKLLAGWRQFDDDLANYQPREADTEAVGRAPEQLPALKIEVKGAVTASNLNAFKDHALAVFEEINTDLQTDGDFANAEKTVKWCKEVETKLDAAKDHALAQTASIDDLFRAIDSIKDEARAKRLELEKLVKARKESMRREIIAEAKQALSEHVAKINLSIDVPIQVPQADFAAAIKGKRTISSLRDATDTLLAQSKIEANASADLVRENLKIIASAAEHAHLFADRAQLVMRETDYVEAVVSSRIAEHKAAEEKRIEAERQRIRAEEQRKAEQAEADRQRAKEEDARKSQQTKDAVSETRDVPEPATRGKVAEPAKARPTDIELLECICSQFRVHESKALEWLLAVDHQSLDEYVMSEFAA